MIYNEMFYKYYKLLNFDKGYLLLYRWIIMEQ